MKNTITAENGLYYITNLFFGKFIHFLYICHFVKEWGNDVLGKLITILLEDKIQCEER